VPFAECLDSRLRGNDGQRPPGIPPGITQGHLVTVSSPGRNALLQRKELWQFGNCLIQCELSAHRKRSQQMKQPLTPTSPRHRLFNAFGVLLLTIIAALLMELPMFDPRHLWTGAVLAVLWSVGLLAWGLRATRSHRSQFRISTILILMTFCALGFANILIPIVAVLVAMIADLGVARTNPRRADYLWRSVQCLAGITGLAHAGRMVYHTFLG